MSTSKKVRALIDTLSEEELSKFQAWQNAGAVKRRWIVFVAGCAVGVAASAVGVYLFGCAAEHRPPVAASSCPTVTATFCAPGPKVVP